MPCCAWVAFGGVCWSRWDPAVCEDCEVCFVQVFCAVYGYGVEVVVGGFVYGY